ncbi:MAG: TrmB family transcriptional regulator [Nanobdellota archaeon]
MGLNELFDYEKLSRYQKNIFNILLSSNPLPANKISKISGVPIGKIYDELNNLIEKEIISFKNTRPRKYYANDPKSTIQNLLKKQRKKLENIEKSALEEIGNKRNIAEVYNNPLDIRQSQIKAFKWSKEEVLQCLGIIHKPNENRDIKRVYEKEIISAVKNGINFMAIYQKGHLPPETLIDLSKKYKNFRIKYSNYPIPRFDIIDENRVLFRIQNPLDTSETLSNIIINNVDLAKKLKLKFMTLWDESHTDAEK